ncbi:carbon storage regulator CsrA [Lutibacter sp. B2]|nr:carbon storage regulator CsrA [Lutibacter sp. B2]
MLILTRKKDESIMINHDIEIKIISIEDGRVKLGISAPKDVEIHRKEIYLEIQEENKNASKGILDLKGIAALFKK